MTSRARTAALTAATALVLLGVFGILPKGSAGGTTLTATVARGTFSITLTESGVLRAAESVTYRSRVEGRELEITYLAPEGTQVTAGDLLVQLDTTALKSELEKARQDARQAEMELGAAELDREEARLAVEAVTEGAGALALDEARTGLWLAQAKANRMREEHARLQPLLARGYITRDEQERSALELQEADARAKLAERALTVLVERTHPREEQAARLQFARRRAQIDHIRPKLEAARAYERLLAAMIQGCSIYAPRPGLVVHEDNVATMPRRKVRVGDRVTSSQGLVTLPDLRRMLVESAIRESDVQLVRPGQPVRVRVDAFSDLRLSGVVARLGALGQPRGAGDTRFDLVVELDGSHSDLRPAMNARIDIVVAERRNATTVPITAVSVEDGLRICHVRRGSSVERRLVEVGGSNDTDVEILDGLKPGERVILGRQEPRGKS